MAPTSRFEKPSTRVYSSPKPTQPDSSTMGDVELHAAKLGQQRITDIFGAAAMARIVRRGPPLTFREGSAGARVRVGRAKLGSADSGGRMRAP